MNVKGGNKKAPIAIENLERSLRLESMASPSDQKLLRVTLLLPLYPQCLNASFLNKMGNCACR